MYFYIVIFFQIFVVLLITVNEYLLGASKEKIRTFLVVINLIFIILSFILGGMLEGVIFIGATLLWAILCVPFAKLIAFKILGFKVPIQNKETDDLNDLIAGNTSIEKYFEKLKLMKIKNSIMFKLF